MSDYSAMAPIGIRHSRVSRWFPAPPPHIRPAPVGNFRASGLAASPTPVLMQLDFSSDGCPEASFVAAFAGASCTYDVGGLEFEVKQQSQETTEQLGTGALVWHAAPALAATLGKHTARLCGDLDVSEVTAIELGCGCSALGGLALAMAGVSRVVVTDLADLLPTISSTLSAYDDTVRQHRQCHPDAPPLPELSRCVSVRSLDWAREADLAAMAGGVGYDIVVASDVDYSELLKDSLVAATCAALKPNITAFALFASAVRSQSILLQFLATLKETGLDVLELSAELEHISESQLRALQNRDDVRYFAARWPSSEVAMRVRAGLAARSAAAPPTGADDARTPTPSTEAIAAAISAAAIAATTISAAAMAATTISAVAVTTPLSSAAAAAAISAVAIAAEAQQNPTSAQYQALARPPR